MTNRRRTVTPLLIALAALLGPIPCVAQTDTIGREAIEELGVSNAREVVVRLAPDWLASRPGGPTYVYVNGSLAGGLDHLATIPTEVIGKMEFIYGARINERLTGQAAYGVGAGIFVDTRERRERTASVDVRTIRVDALTVHLGRMIAPAASPWADGMDGWGTPANSRTMPGLALASAGIVLPFDLVLTGTFWVVEETHEQWESEMGLVANATYDEFAMGATLGRRFGPVRLAAGVANSVVRYSMASHECNCINERGGRDRMTAPMAEISLEQSVRGPFLVSARLGAVLNPEREIEPFSGRTVDIGGLRSTLTLGLGVGR